MENRKNLLLDCKNFKSLIGKSILFLVIPYAYLFLCGFVFDMLLKWYFMTTFTFFSMIALYIVAIVLIVCMCVRYRKKKKNRKAKRSKESIESKTN